MKQGELHVLSCGNHFLLQKVPEIPSLEPIDHSDEEVLFQLKEHLLDI